VHGRGPAPRRPVGTQDGPINAVDARELTDAEVRTRLAVYDDLAERKRHDPDLAQAEIVETGPMLAFARRASSRGCTRSPPTSAGRGAVRRPHRHGLQADHPLLRLSALPGARGLRDPYRCMLPKDVDGLLVAGRCMSSDQPPSSRGAPSGRACAWAGRGTSRRSGQGGAGAKRGGHQAAAKDPHRAGRGDRAEPQARLGTALPPGAMQPPSAPAAVAPSSCAPARSGAGRRDRSRGACRGARSPGHGRTGAAAGSSALGGVRADVHDLHAQALVVALEAELGQGGKDFLRCLLAHLLHHLGGDGVRLHDHERPEPPAAHVGR